VKGTIMRRHHTDLVALLFGAAFTIAGIGYLLRETTDAISNPTWATGLGMILLGAIALVATLARSRNDEEPAPVSAASSEPADELTDG
jgi:uncharacterized membrane protein